ncbi:MAG: citrate synthase [Gemmataceae bacterium]|nr:citrate synthase [Gemmataceae bacterium]MCI0739844.1 citrate synthase [Gemmataceae bacterium]
MSAPEIYSPGLEGVIAGETAISTVTDGLKYRGYSVVQLCEKATFEQVAYMLLHGELPDKSKLADFCQRVQAAAALPKTLGDLLKQLPKDAVPMDVLRTGVSILAHYDPDVGDDSRAANLRKAERLLGQIPRLLAESYRASKGLPAPATKDQLGFAGNLLFMLKGKEPTPFETKAFDVSLILYAEHEFNASTFTARVITSTESDMHSAVVGAIGALKGRLHGGANEKVMDLLRAAGGPESAEKWLRDAMARKEKVMGFGHRVYKTGDVRAKFLKEYARQAAEQTGNTKWEKTAEVIEEILGKEKNLFPNLDWPAGRLYHALGLEVPLYTPFFVASRITGWCAHIMEQAENNRIIRPRARYTGPGERMP